jgi:chromosome partitioning protein
MITALISRKGGVGKTTTAVNLSAALAGVGKRVLLIDLDSQASASISLGVSRSSLAPSISDVLLYSAAVKPLVRRTGHGGLDLVTGSIDLVSVDEELARLPGREGRLRAALTPLSQDYDFVILDCPPSLSLVSVNALVAADNYVLPAVPHYLSLAGIDGLIATVDRLTDKYGVRTELLGIVLTQVDYRTRASRENVEEIRKRYGSSVFAMEIRTNIRLAEAPARGQTVFQYDPGSTGAKAYRLLAAELLMRGRAQKVHREESKRRQDYERERRERRGESLPVAEVLSLSDLRRSSRY